MKKSVMYLIIIICIVIICIFLNMGNVESNNSTDINYDALEFERIEIASSKMNRYNELINIPQASFLIRNLYGVLEKNSINLEPIVVYCYNYATYFKNDSEKYIVQNSGKTYIDCTYIQSIVYELFNQNINLSKYKTKENYILIEDSSVATDTITLDIQDILYNKEYNLYKIIINEDKSNINIIYKYIEGKYILLYCTENNS